jgi:hypothetical protein
VQHDVVMDRAVPEQHVEELPASPPLSVASAMRTSNRPEPHGLDPSDDLGLEHVVSMAVTGIRRSARRQWRGR